jgi:hypothetical protein
MYKSQIEAPDNKGGFRIESGATCYFRAGKDIAFWPVFWAKAGSTVTVSIMEAPNSFNP